MRLRYPLFALALLLVSPEAADAKPRTAAIADLNIEEPTGSQLLAKVRSDLTLGGYTLNEKAELLRGLQGASDVLAGTGEARKRLGEAQESYENFNLVDALSKLQAMDQILLRQSIGAREQELLAERYLLAGLIRVSQSEGDKAINNFRLAHRLKPSVSQLDAGSHRPSVVSMYADAVRQNKAAKTAKLLRAWQPSAAELYVDGERFGKKDKLTQGPHILSLRAKGYQGKSVAVSLSKSTTHKDQLQELTQVQALHNLRVKAAGASLQDTRVLAQLAALAAVDTLIVLRRTDDGPQAAIFDSASSGLSAWVQVGSVRWESLLTHEESAGGAIALGAASQGKQEAPWFKQWWGGGLIVGGTAVIGTAIYFALSASDSSDTEATIDQWCFGSCN